MIKYAYVTRYDWLSIQIQLNEVIQSMIKSYNKMKFLAICFV